MTHPIEPRRPAILLLAITCLAPLLFCLGAFLVNVEVAIRVFHPALPGIGRFLPANLYHLWVTLSADLSTVSTLIPVLILAFPLIHVARLLAPSGADPAFARRLGPDPYPSHFGFFQVMLGLTGTLYGMYIGLDVSGVSQLAGQAPTADSIRQSLDRLLGGTATALLSSLVGLIGAFLTARPVPWLFGRVMGVQADETRQTLTATIEHLTGDLRGLSQASRAFAEYLNPETANTLLRQLERQETATREAGRQLDHIARLLEAQSDRMDQTLRALATPFEAVNRQLEQLALTQQQANELIRQLIATQGAGQQETVKILGGLVTVATAQRDQVQRDQEALRSALAAYLTPGR